MAPSNDANAGQEVSTQAAVELFISKIIATLGEPSAETLIKMLSEAANVTYED